MLNINPFVPYSPFLYHLKTENRKVFCFQGVEKGCVENAWVKQNRLNCVKNSVFLEICESDFSDFYINTTDYQYSKVSYLSVSKTINEPKPGQLESN